MGEELVLDDFITEAIRQQEGLGNELLDSYNFLNRMKESLKASSTYEEFVQKELVKDEHDEISATLKAIRELTKAILKEHCNSKARAYYMLDAEKRIIDRLSTEIQASKVYEMIPKE